IMEKKDSKIFISAAQEQQIDLYLPKQNSYMIMGEAGEICKFDFAGVEIVGEDGEKISFNKDGIFVNDDGEIVKIHSEGIFVENAKERVSISSKGIIVQSDEEDVNITGFWGSLLGSAIKGVTGAVITNIGKNPERIIKKIINKEDNNGMNIKVNLFNWSAFESESDDYLISEFNGSYSGMKNSKVNVFSRNGNVTITQWDKDYVDIYAKILVSKRMKNANKELKEVKVEILEKDGCTINTKYRKNSVKATVSYEIKVPKNYQLGEIHVRNGFINVSGINNGNLITSNGNIIINNCRGNLKAQTSNAIISAKHIDGKLSAKTRNANITVEEVKNIKNLSTSNADIYADILTLDEDVTISSSNGSISVAIFPGISGEIMASTSNGNIKVSDLDIHVEKQSSAYLKASMGGGGNLLNLSSSNANLYISTKKNSL
ncbi:MAG: hypothetical protein KAS49_06575, partial [Candidatus Cloacimonetes bacterium]|nr:hypothetical protein [Candidatus Cloacimonadota bacterium]